MGIDEAGFGGCCIEFEVVEPPCWESRLFNASITRFDEASENDPLLDVSVLDEYPDFFPLPIPK